MLIDPTIIVNMLIYPTSIAIFPWIKCTFQNIVMRTLVFLFASDIFVYNVQSCFSHHDSFCTS